MQFRDLDIDVVVKRIRTLRLTVKPSGQVMMSVPLGMTNDDIMRFLNAHYEWILRAQNKLQQRTEKQKKLRYESGEMHLLFGKELPLRVELERGRESVDFQPDEIILYAHPDRTPAERKKLLYQGYYVQFMPVFKAIFEKWSERLTQEMSSVTRLANPNKYKYFNVSIKLMRTEWGSCTPGTRRMSFNIDLVRLPKECIEYVVVHEFTHIDRCDHSPAFWALCDRRLAAAGLLSSKEMRARIKQIISVCGGY